MSTVHSCMEWCPHDVRFDAAHVLISQDNLHTSTRVKAPDFILSNVNDTSFKVVRMTVYLQTRKEGVYLISKTKI